MNEVILGMSDQQKQRFAEDCKDLALKYVWDRAFSDTKAFSDCKPPKAESDAIESLDRRARLNWGRVPDPQLILQVFGYLDEKTAAQIQAQAEEMRRIGLESQVNPHFRNIENR